MTQRVWIVAFACGLGAGQLAGCTHMQPHQDDPNLVRDTVKPPPEPPRNSAASPYQAADGKRELQKAGENKGQIERLRYTSNASDREAPLRAGMVPDRPTEPGRFSSELFPAVFPRAADSGPSPPDQPVELALHYFLAKRLKDAVHAIERYDKPTQEALLLLLPWVARLGEGSLTQTKPQEISTFLEQIEDFGNTLRPGAALALGKVCFCHEIRGFGVIDQLPEDYAFQAASDGKDGERMQLYVEVRNFASRTAGRLYETRLAADVQIHDARGRPVWRHIFPAAPDSCVSPRHDYFLVLSFWVPRQLTAGRYTLVLEVSDQTWQSGRETPPHRIACRRLNFEVMAGDSAHGLPLSNVAPPSAGGGG